MIYLLRPVENLSFDGTEAHGIGSNRQGPYSGDGDIVVLCAYLGQLARVRDALASEVIVVIDERDQRELDNREGEQSGDEPSLTTVERVRVTSKVGSFKLFPYIMCSKGRTVPPPHC